MDTLAALGTCSASFSFVLPSEACTVTSEAWAAGLVSGHLEEWKDYLAYECRDRVGGWAASATSVS
jgi:hypothetical protein